MTDFRRGGAAENTAEGAVMKAERFQVDLLNGPIIRAILLFTIPLFVSYVFQQLYNAVDTVLIGRFLDETSLVAVGACAALYELLVGFGIGFGNGMSIVAARAFGSGDIEKLKKITASSLVITAGVTVFIMAVSGLFLKPVMVLLKTPPERLDEAYSYISAVTQFCGVLFAYNLFAGLLRAVGNSFVPLLFLIFSSVLNILFDVVFIRHYGTIRGAAVATVLAQFVSAVGCAVYIFVTTKTLVPSARHFVPDKAVYRDLLGQGLSMAFMGAIVHSGTVILQRAINSLDEMVIAGHLCARKIFTLTNIPIITLGLSTSTFVSQNCGAGQVERIRKGVRGAVLLTVVWTALLLVPAWFGVRPLVVFMTGSENPVIVEYAASYILFTVPFYVVLGGLIIIRNALQGLGLKFLPLVSSFIELAGKILFTYLVIPRMGSWGVILCEPLIWCVMLAQLAAVFFRLPLFRGKAVS